MTNFTTQNQVDLKKSHEIFNSLMKGKIINEYIYDETTQQLKRNELFTEIRNHYFQYKTQYDMNGMELIEKPNYFYILDMNSKQDLKQPTKTKIYSAMIILIRYIMFDKGRVYDYLKNINYGVSIDDLVGLEDNINYQHILKTSKIDKGEIIIRTLFEKNLLLKVKNNKYILSDSGLDIVNDILEQNKS